MPPAESSKEVAEAITATAEMDKEVTENSKEAAERALEASESGKEATEIPKVTITKSKQHPAIDSYAAARIKHPAKGYYFVS